MRDWLEASLLRLSKKSDTSAAIRYALGLWDALLRSCRPQQAAFLAILAETPGVMVSKNDLKARLWPNETPTKNRLNALASAAWALLGDGNPDKRKYFVAAGRDGYCFICPVKRVEL